MRVGPKRSRHLPIAGVEHEVELTLEPAPEPTELVVRCEGGARPMTPGAPASAELRLPCPPDRRVDVVLGARPSQVAPFGLAIAPVQRPGGGPTIHGGPA